MFQFLKSKTSSRSQIKIKEVKDGVLILPDDKYRVVMETSSVNFELKSDEEQDMIIENFQNFLNSLPCQVQILIRIRELDIDSYLAGFKGKNNHENDRKYLKLIKDYGYFVKGLVKGNKILTRRFYIIIPYETQETNDFNLIKEQISLSQDIVAKGMEKMGMKTRNLDSLEILELFYSFYNPGLQKVQKLRNETIKVISDNYHVHKHK
jgi:hypothetical protein